MNNRKSVMLLCGVTAVSLAAAAVGHAYCREFCMAFKPMAWPFVALAYVIFRNLKTKGKKK